MPASLADVSGSKDAFVQAVGGCYEKSPWVAERAFAQGPFASVSSIAAAMKQTLAEATDDEVLSLLRAHPDLAGRAALKGDVTAESASEQAKAGLGSLTAAELSKLTSLNERYTAKFGFPFILAVRNASKRVIFAALERRMAGDLVEERAEALVQVHKIAWLRLLDSVEGNGKGFLTCHVLDVASGTPAAGMSVTLARLGDHGDLPASYAFTTNEDGRLDGPALRGVEFRAGAYEWTFRVGEYFAAKGVATAPTPFLGDVPIRFGIDNPEEHYHVPLLCSPWTFSTYRGS